MLALIPSYHSVTLNALKVDVNSTTVGHFWMHVIVVGVFFATSVASIMIFIFLCCVMLTVNN